MEEKGYHKLLIWQKAKSLAKVVYKVTSKLPDSEKTGLTSQTRRAAISVVLNIVEGHRRQTSKEFLRFLNIADGSLVEVESCLELLLDLGFITQTDYVQVETSRKELAVMLTSFIKSIKLR